MSSTLNAPIVYSCWIPKLILNAVLS